jgi:hypothetical protein
MADRMRRDRQRQPKHGGEPDRGHDARRDAGRPHDDLKDPRRRRDIELVDSVLGRAYDHRAHDQHDDPAGDEQRRVNLGREEGLSRSATTYHGFPRLITDSGYANRSKSVHKLFRIRDKTL